MREIHRFRGTHQIDVRSKVVAEPRGPAHYRRRFAEIAGGAQFVSFADLERWRKPEEME